MFSTTEKRYYFCIVVTTYDDAIALIKLLRDRLFFEETFGTHISLNCSFLLNKYEFKFIPDNWIITFDSHREHNFNGGFEEAIYPTAVQAVLEDFEGKIKTFSYRQTIAKTDISRLENMPK